MSAIANPTRPWRLPISWIVRVLVSVVVLVVLFRFVRIEEVWGAVQRISPLLWLAALALFLAGHATSAAKWLILIGNGISFGQAFRAHLAGLAANLCLPGAASGDVVRAGLVFASAKDKSALAMGSFADRLLDTLGLLIISAVGMALAAGPASGNSRLILPVMGLFLACVVGGFLASIALDQWLQRRAPTSKVVKLAAKVIAAAASLARRPARLALCLAMSMAVQTVFICINIAFANAIGIHAPPAAWFFAWSASKIIIILPVSMNGLGVREASMALLMAPFGAPKDLVVAVGLIWQAVLYASGAIGAVVQAIWRPAKSGAGARDSMLGSTLTPEGTVRD